MCRKLAGMETKAERMRLEGSRREHRHQQSQEPRGEWTGVDTDAAVSPETLKVKGKQLQRQESGSNENPRFICLENSPEKFA